MKLEHHAHEALEDLAKCNTGRQGQGFIKSAKIAMELFQIGYARPVKNGDRNLCAVTLEGFRFLQSKRNGAKA
jgi:hypothetical protein